MHGIVSVLFGGKVESIIRRIVVKKKNNSRRTCYLEVDETISRARDLVEVLRHKLILEVLLEQQSSSPSKSSSDSVL